MDREIKLKGLLILILCSLNCVSSAYRNKLNLENQTNQIFQFLERYPLKTLPLIDSTNFENYSNSVNLKREQCKLLKLEKINPNKDVAFRVNYKLNLSPNFKSLVVSYFPNEQELFTVLINYTNSFDIIDFKTIAYDEIAESFIKTKSLISSEKIKIIQKDESSGSNKLKTMEFEINKDGQFKACQ